MGRAFPFLFNRILFYFLKAILCPSSFIQSLDGSVVEDPFKRAQSKNKNGALSSRVEEKSQEPAAVIRRINGLLLYHEILGTLDLELLRAVVNHLDSPMNCIVQKNCPNGWNLRLLD